MYNLYQTALRNDINKKVFHKPMMEVELFGTMHHCIVKEMKLGPWTVKRFQLLGVVLPDDPLLIKKEIKRLRTTLGGKFGHILIQWGIINHMVQFDNVSHRSKQFKTDMKKMRLGIRQRLRQSFGLRLSLRENMPQANIIYEINKPDEQLLSEMNSGCKERVKKSLKKGAIYRVVEEKDYDTYYQDRQLLAGAKGFSIIAYDVYKRLVQYIRDNDCGDVFVAEIDGEIIAGSICLYDEHRIIYHSGFATRDRKFRNIGAHHFLKFSIFGWAREKGLTYCDMLGGAPTGFADHPLAGVSKFKEALGGIKIEYYGNYDIILNPFLYMVFSLRQKRKAFRKSYHKSKAKNRSTNKSTTR